jgi:hypothetical protein
MRTKLIAIVIAAAFPLGAYAQMTNQPQQQQRPGASGAAEPRGGSGAVQPGVSQLDSNRDGLISRQEAQRSSELSSRFSELDRNRDGSLSADEISNASSPAGSSGRSGTSPMKRP